jgi:TolA-binding protein
LIKYDKAEYKQAEKDLFAFFKQKPSYNYWLGQGYVLLGKNYAQQGDTAQAKATLRSVIDKYSIKDDGVIALATEELTKITDAENRMQEKKKMDIRKEEEEPIEKPDNE